MFVTAQNIFRSLTEVRKERILERLREIKYKTSNLELHACIDQYMDKLNHDYLLTIDQVGHIFRRLVESKIFKSFTLTPNKDIDSFWESVIGRWGGGAGYYSDVLSMYKKMLGELDIHAKTLYKEKWHGSIVQPLVNVLMP